MALYEMTQKETNNENRETCKRIAEDIDAFVNGYIRRCPDCNTEIHRDWDDVGDQFKCPECGAVSDPDEWEQLSIWDYLDDALDVEFRVKGKGCDDVVSVQICIAWGGPGIYLDTATKNVELYWWSDRASYPLSYEAVNAINEWADEYWGCL